MSKLAKKIKNGITGLVMKLLLGLERKERNRRLEERLKRHRESIHHPLE